MKDEKTTDYIRIADEVAKELIEGKPSTSLLLERWKKENPRLYRQLKEQEHLPEEMAFHDSIDVEEALGNVRRRLFAHRTAGRTLRIFSAAASVLLLLGISALWLTRKGEEAKVPEWATYVPGNEKTSIVTHDNRTVTLETNNLTVADGRLVGYTDGGEKKVAVELQQSPKFNKLSVPVGGEYLLTLEDGTTAQVNTGSELLFPTRFDGKTRQVRLKGEAYFNVKTNPEIPFVVQLDNGLNIEVTGTAFNVKAYEEENETSIALVEGSVTVRRETETLAALTPGQVFTYRKETRQHTVTAPDDLSALTDWTNETFVFRDETIGNIMHKLSRWYNVDITVSESIAGLRYTGVLSRKQPLADVLDALRMTNELDFYLHGDKKVDVEKKSNQ